MKIYIGRPDRKSAVDILQKYMLPSLPFSSETLEQFGGSTEAACAGLIERMVQVIYSPNSYLNIYEKDAPRERRAPVQKRKAISDIVSGATLENIVTRTKRLAIRHELESGKRGIGWQDDVFEAIRIECEESKEQYISEVRTSRDIVSAEAFAVDVHLAGAVTESIEAATKWFRGKNRAWAKSV